MLGRALTGPPISSELDRWLRKGPVIHLAFTESPFTSLCSSSPAV